MSALDTNVEHLHAIRREIREGLGRMLRGHREALGLTQRHVSERLAVETHTVRRWEQGTRVPTDENFALLIALLGLTIEDVLDAVRAAIDSRSEASERGPSEG